MIVVPIFGVPGTGKSTLVRHILLRLIGLPPYQVRKRGTATYHVSSVGPVLVLGTYPPGEIYGGTDRLSMSCQKDVLELFRIWSSHGHDGRVLFEGDRLASAKFLASCQADHYTLRPFYLRTPEAQRRARFAERGSSQTEQFLKGRETKIRNLAAAFPGTWLDSIVPEDIEKNAEQIIKGGLI